MVDKRVWKRVVFSAECDEDGMCPVCGDIDFADCDCPGPTQDDLYDYEVHRGVLCAALKENPGNDIE